MSRASQLINRIDEIKPIKHCRTCDVYGDDEECPQCGEIMEVIGANSLGGMSNVVQGVT
jgi:predicted RNA-binding protein with PUA domain